MASNNLTAQRLRELLHYDPELGWFMWKVERASTARAGQIAGCPNPRLQGCIVIGIDNRLYRAHRLAFLWMTGAWPASQVDHIFGDPSDNRWSKLRNATSQINGQNRRRPNKNNKIGLLGVTRQGQRLRARIFLDGRTIHLGYFDTAEQAHDAFVEAKRRLHEGCTL